MGDFIPSKKDLVNALAWFASPINDVIQKGKETAKDIAEWLWVVLKGDFEEEQTTAQVITGTVISMIPFVDQICDIRDMIANVIKIDEDNSNGWAWFALILTIIGFFPELGSLFKGIMKVLFAPIRRFMLKPATKAMKFTGENLYKMAEPAIEEAITELNKYLARPEVRKALQAMKIANAYKWIAENIRKIKALASKQYIIKKFDEYIGYLQSFVGYIDKYASRGIALQAKQLLEKVLHIRKLANEKLGVFLQPINGFLEKLAKRIEKEGDEAFKASTNVKNLHTYKKIEEKEEMDAIAKNKPNWVHKVPQNKQLPFPEAKFDPKTPLTPFHPSLGAIQPILKSGYGHPLKNAYKTFAINQIKPQVYHEGEVLVRVVGVNSFDNSICWMRKVDFDKLKSREEWRDKFAVWASWNENGEYLEYTVPKGKKLYGWEGPAASQVRGNYYLKGGGIQIVVDPNDLVKSGLSKRKITGWGYGTDTSIGSFSMVGVPTLNSKLGDYSLLPALPNKSNTK
ncbi:hypothetical protein ACG9Y7_04005 [Acinetobacter gerneri]|uniref:hypothetical protein n=1 Tax=Acinetobacter gerneri TaxID=202952 RepID=UPI003AF54DCB